MTDQLQPLDTLMNKLGLSNADLVAASTEQLSFKNVQKGRTGRPVTPNIQDKILTALAMLKPDLKLRKRDLFRYEPSPEFAAKVQEVLKRARTQNIPYAQFLDLLGEAGVIAYTVEVGPNRMTFFAFGGEAYTEKGPEVSADAPGLFRPAGIVAAIADAKKRVINHFQFLERIHDAGVGLYDVNVRKRRIDYKGADASHREQVGPYVPGSEIAAPPAAPAASEKPKLSNKKKKAAALAKKKKKPGIVRTTRKKRLTMNKLYRAKKRAARRPKGKPSNPKTKRGPKK